MARKNGWTAKQVIAAIDGTLGIQTTIAKKLGCNRETVAAYIDKYPTVREAWLNERMKLKDKAFEGLAFHLREKEWKAIAFTLTHLADAGDIVPPTQRQEITGKGGQDFTIQLIEVDGKNANTDSSHT